MKERKELIADVSDMLVVRDTLHDRFGVRWALKALRESPVPGFDD